MTAVGLLVALGIVVAFAALTLLFGVDSRPSAADRQDVWFGHRG